MLNLELVSEPLGRCSLCTFKLYLKDKSVFYLMSNDINSATLKGVSPLTKTWLQIAMHESKSIY